MWMKSRILRLLLAALSSAGIVFAEDQRSRLDYFRELECVSEREEGKCFFRFDAELYGHVDQPGAGLRLYEPDSGAEVPFRVVVEANTESLPDYRRVPEKLIGFERQQNCGYFIVENPGLAGVARLRVITPDRDFDKTIEVEASEDRKSWVTVAGPEPFFDYSSRVALRRDRISFPSCSKRYFRVRIGEYAEARELPYSRVTTDGEGTARKVERSRLERELKVDAIELETPETRRVSTPTLRNHPLSLMERRESARRTELHFASNREPVTEVAVTADLPNYARRVVLSGSDDNLRFEKVAEGVIHKLRVGRFREDSPALRFAPVRFRFYRLEIFNGDDRPLETVTVEARGIVHRAEFLSAAPRLELYYGGTVPAPVYDLSPVLDRLEEASGTEYLLLAGRPNPLREPDRSRFFRFLPGAAFVLALFGIGFALWHGFRRIRQV